MTWPVTIGQASDIAEMVALQPQWQLDYQQLSGGRFQGQIVNAALPGLHLTKETSNRASRQQGRLFSGDIGQVLADSMKGPCRYHGQLATRDAAMMGPAAELDLLTPDDCQLRAILMPRERFLALLWQLYPHAAERIGNAHSAVELAPAEAALLRQMIDQALQHLSTEPEGAEGSGRGRSEAVARQMQDAIVLTWQDLMAARCAPEPAAALMARTRRALVERSCQYVREHLPEPTTMLALCRAVGASPRKLTYCFQDVLGMAPARYLRLMRLNGVHRDLVRNTEEGGAPTVQDVASRWGFWHMGAFAGEYRRMFGRLPSQTLGLRDTTAAGFFPGARKWRP